MAGQEQYGYHVSKIDRGVYGCLNKVNEEVMEAMDAELQGNQLMVLIELSDIVGAIEGYLEAKYGDSINIDHVIKMARSTRRAFESGERK